MSEKEKILNIDEFVKNQAEKYKESMQDFSATKIEAELKSLEKDKDSFIYKNIQHPAAEYKNKLLKDFDLEIRSYREKEDSLKKLLKEKKKELEEKRNTKYPPEVIQYVNRIYGSGVNFGYGQLKLRYVDPQNRFIIITQPGGTAGTGTAMGTGGYYYANVTHVVVFPQYGGYFGQVPKKGFERGVSNQLFEREGAKLTNEIKQQMIKEALEYCKEYNIEPFDLKEIIKYKKQ